MLSKSLRFGRLASQLATRNMHMKQAAMQFRYMPSVQMPHELSQTRHPAVGLPLAPLGFPLGALSALIGHAAF